MIWTVHEKAGVRRAVPDAAAKWALVFGALWLLYHRLWWETLAFGLLTLLVNRLAEIAFPGDANPAQILTYGLLLLPRLWLLLEGNEMRRAKLFRQGYATVGVVEAADREGATMRALPA